MSGGHFEYIQYRISEAAEDIDRMIKDNDKPNSWGDVPGYSAETVRSFREAAVAIKLAAIFIQRIDWLVSGDDGEASYHKRLNQDVDKLIEEINNA